MQSDQFMPFFIIGSPRSGTTLLERMLNRNSKIFVPPETAFFFRLYAKGYSDKVFSLKVAEKFLDHYLESRPAQLLGLSVSEHKQRLLQSADSFSGIFRNLMSVLSEGHNSKLVGEKTPHHLKCIDYILSSYPKAPVIAMVRDGRAVISSRVRHPNWSNSLLTAAWRWREDAIALQRLINSDKSEQILVVRYENLVSDPNAEIEAICKHLGVEFEPAMTAVNHNENAAFQKYYEQDWMSKSTRDIDQSRINAWREDFTKREISFIENEIASELSGLGYDLLGHSSDSLGALKAKEIVKHVSWKFRQKMNSLR